MQSLKPIALSVAIVVAIACSGCQKKTSSYTKLEPAQVEHGKDDELSRITLTEKAMERLGIATAPVREDKSGDAADAETQSSVPDSALMYVPSGGTFVYTSPSPRTFVRQAVDVDHIEGGLAVLKKGPPVGTEVVTIGAVELFGTEFGVGH